MRSDSVLEEEAAGAGFALSQLAGPTRSKAIITVSASRGVDGATFLDVNITVGALERSIYGFATRVPTVAPPNSGAEWLHRRSIQRVSDKSCRRELMPASVLPLRPQRRRSRQEHQSVEEFDGQASVCAISHQIRTGFRLCRP